MLFTCMVIINYRKFESTRVLNITQSLEEAIVGNTAHSHVCMINKVGVPQHKMLMKMDKK